MQTNISNTQSRTILIVLYETSSRKCVFYKLCSKTPKAMVFRYDTKERLQLLYIRSYTLIIDPIHHPDFHSTEIYIPFRFTLLRIVFISFLWLLAKECCLNKIHKTPFETIFGEKKILCRLTDLIQWNTWIVPHVYPINTVHWISRL